MPLCSSRRAFFKKVHCGEARHFLQNIFLKVFSETAPKTVLTMPFRESSPNCGTQTLFRSTFSEKIPRSTFQNAFPMRFLETRPSKAFPEGFLDTLSQKGFCESLSQGPSPRHFSREPFLRRLPKTFPERLPPPAFPKTRFRAPSQGRKKGMPLSGHPPFYCFVSARRPDATVRITKETANRGETRDTF